MTVTPLQPRTLVLELPERYGDMPSLPSANVLKSWNWGRQRWRITKLKTAYAGAILEALARRGAPWGTPCARARVEIERRARKLMDEDNAVAGAKYIQDQLVRSGILASDAPGCVQLVVTQKVARMRAGDRRGVTVTVREIEP